MEDPHPASLSNRYSAVEVTKKNASKNAVKAHQI
jgi:hypothetical protein